MAHIGRDFRRLASVAVAGLGFFAATGAASAQELLVEDITVEADRSVNVQNILATHPAPLQGYSLSLSYDPAIYEMLSVSWKGSSTDLALGGEPPNFWIGKFDPAAGAIIVACVLRFVEQATIPPADDQDPSVLAVVKYRIRPL